MTRTYNLRRLPAKGLPRLLYKMRRLWRRSLEIRTLWIALYILICTWCLLQPGLFFSQRVEVGAIAARTRVADRDLTVTNEAATFEVQARARDEVLPVYDLDRDLERTLRAQLAELFRIGREGLIEQAGNAVEESGEPASGADGGVEGPEVSEGPDLLVRLSEESSLKLTAEQVELLVRKGMALEMEERLSGLLARVLRQGVVSNRALLLENRVRGIVVRDLPSGGSSTQLDLYGYRDYPDQVREALAEDLRDWPGIRSRERQHLVEMLLTNITPNLTFNSQATQELREQAAEGVGTVLHQIRKGEVIVRKGDQIDEVAAQAIADMSGSRNLQRLLLTVLGTVLLLAAAALILWIGLGREPRLDRSRERLLSESLLLITLHLVGVRFAFFLAGAIAGAIEREPYSSLESYLHAIPFASLALLSVLLYGRGTAVMHSLVLALLVGPIADGELMWQTVVYALTGSLAAIYALDSQHFRQRSMTTLAGFTVGLANAVAVLILMTLGGVLPGGVSQLGFDLLCAFVSGLLAAAVVSFTLPIFESLLSITTRIKLIELSNPNLPLLRRLALEAPGTFQHSLAVANLAKAGCDAIDADSVLVNTGALYHDIGKILRPQYFVENQIPGQNLHDKIQPTMSALILINHVKDGLEMATEARLPEPILSAIEQHHGTRLIKFFYNRASERCAPESGEVREDEFRYPGPKPQSKEMGVLMLADAVEAASRTLVDPSRQKIRTLIRRLLDDCLQDKQLDQTDLTLGDLRKVEEAFQRVLSNIHHRRVDYPGFDFNRGQGKKSRSSDETLSPEADRRKAS